MFEKWIQFAIQYRYLVALSSLVLALCSIFIINELIIDAVPDITNNQVQINTQSPGLSPEEIEKKITLPIEMALQGIRGLEGTRSLSRNGFSQVTAIFDEEMDIYFARQQIAERLHSIEAELPAEPQMGSLSTGLGEVYMWVLDFEEPKVFSTPGWQKEGSYVTPEGKKLKNELELLSYLREVQDWIIKPRLKGIKGLADVDSIGGFVKEYHVMPNPDRISHYGISFEDIALAITENHLNLGASFIDKKGESFLVKADGRLNSIEDLYSISIPLKNGSQIRMKEIAEIGIGKEERTGGATFNGKEVVIGTAMMRIGENSRTVSKRVDEKLQTIKNSLPPGIHLTPVLDRTKLIDATINTVKDNLFEGALLVIAILFLFLGNVRAALITACVIPLSMLLTIIGMVQTKMSGNLMSLGAIDFGLIVDGAVIITENALRRLSDKRQSLGRTLFENERLEEIKTSTLEMIRPSLFGQLIIITVYLPILTLSGIEGKMFKPMAYTVVMALLAALFLSITFIPAIISIWIKEPKEEKQRWMRYLQQKYENFLQRALQKPTKIIFLGLMSLVCALFIFLNLGQEFMTSLDEGDIAIQVTRIPSTALDQSLNMQKKIEESLNTLDEVKLVFSKTGTAEMATDPMPKDASDTFVMLKPRSQWVDPHLSKEGLIKKMEGVLEGLLGNQFEYTQPINMRFNELIGGVKSDVAIHLFGDDFSILSNLASKVGTFLGKIPGASDVVVEPIDGIFTMELVPDRHSLSLFGLNVRSLLSTFESAIQGKKVAEMYEGDRKFDVVVRLSEEDRTDQKVLENLPINPGVALRDVAKLKVSEGLNQISRMDGKRMVTVQANVRDRDLGSFVGEIQKKLKNNHLLPPGYWYSIGGQFENLAAAKERLAIVVPLCLLLIGIFLYLSLGSIKDAMVVFSSIPFALVGGVVLLWISGMPFSISSAIGLIALSGIAVLNGLVLITSIRKYMQKLALDPSIIRGSVERLRPVLMTASVASFGFIPMALSSGAGAEVQKPIATVVIGGLISSTLLTLIILPLLLKVISQFEFKKVRIVRR